MFETWEVRMKIQRFAWIGLGATLVGCGELSAFVDPEPSTRAIGTPARRRQTNNPVPMSPPMTPPAGRTRVVHLQWLTPAVSQTTLDDANPSQSRLVHRSVNVAAYPNDEFQLVSFKARPTMAHRAGNYDVADLNMSDWTLRGVTRGLQRNQLSSNLLSAKRYRSVLALDGVEATSPS